MKRSFSFCPLAFTGLILIFTSCCKEELEIPTVITMGFEELTSTSARVNGNLVSTGGHYVNVVFYYSDIITVPTRSDNYILAGSGDQPGNFSVWIYDLTPGTEYYVRACALGFGDIVSYANVITFSTLGSVVGDIIFNPDLMYGSLTDIVGNIYRTIEIGSQTWMAENLKTTKYNDGTNIPLVIDLTDWHRTTPGYFWYLNDEAKYKSPYGALYNWYTVNTGKLCPTGWHVPSDTEWTTLTSNLGGESITGGQLKETGITHWITNNSEITNSSGFTALPGGTRWGYQIVPTRYFSYLSYVGGFWSTTEYSGNKSAVYFRTLNGISEECVRGWDSKVRGFSIRCLKD
jgi:uncharacterized protein (TIGR02145 family)